MILDYGFEPLVYRYFLLGSHYRTQITFSWEGLEAAKTSLTRLYELAFEWGDPGQVHRPTLKAIQKDLNDDLAMPKALATLWRMVKSDLAPSKKKATLLEFDKVLGLDIENWNPEKLDIPAEVEKLVQERSRARKEKLWEKADEIREKISSLGYNIKDEGDVTKILLK